MRADRLIATLLLLQTRSQVTARELAAELEVSEKTARRDLEALSTAGLPVYPQVGRGGGWRLLGEGRTDLSGFTVDETRSLFLAIATAGASAALPGEVDSALRKLMRALPETFRADAELAARAVMVDPISWRGSEPLSPASPMHLDALQRAVFDRRAMRLSYSDRRGTITERVVRPLGLVSKGAVWYLVGDTEHGLRTFRVDRMRTIDLTDEQFERPPDFDLAAAWRTVVASVADRRMVVTVTILVDPSLVGALRHQFGDDLMVAEIDPTFEPTTDARQRERVVIGGPSERMIAQHLAGWGNLVEVVEPDAVKAQLSKLACELAELYG